MKKSLLNVEFTDVDLMTCIEMVKRHIQSGKEEPYHVITANPEIVMQINRDKEFMETARKAGLITADGIGIIWGSKLLKNEIKNRVIGVELLLELLAMCEHEKLTVYLLGADEMTMTLMNKFVHENYPNLNLIGSRHGFFDVDDDGHIIEAINKLNPDLLVMGMGSPRSHLWFNSRRTVLNIKATVDIGGAFDAITGTVKRAPRWVSNIHLEWLYRRMQNRERAKRQKDLYKFVIEIFKVRHMKEIHK